jgi:hypothetical protein
MRTEVNCCEMEQVEPAEMVLGFMSSRTSTSTCEESLRGNRFLQGTPVVVNSANE